VSIAQDKLAKLAIVARGPSRRVYLTKAAPRVLSQQDLPLMLRWSFLLFVGSIVFDIFVVISSSAKLCGFLFIAIYFFYHNPFFGERSLPAVPRATIWFLIYVAVYTLNGLFLPTERLHEFSTRLFTLIQFVLFLWIVPDILKDEKMAKNALLVFANAAAIQALGLLLSLPGFAATEELGVERTSTGGNANVAAGLAGLAAVVLLGLWLNLSRKGGVKSVWMVGSVLALLLRTVYTGSRGGVIMLMIGLSVYLFPYWKSRWRMSAGLVALTAMASLAYIAATTPVFSERWLEFYEGKESTRDRIYEEAFVMVSERPFRGWQPSEFAYELGSRTGLISGRDAHNLYLHLLLEVGLMGAVPFLIGLSLCGQAAWKARSRSLGLLPLAIFVAILVEGMSSTTIYKKPTWFILAVAIAVGTKKKRRGMILAGRVINNRLQRSP
jgi:O-antigen ligase